jgi:hypothetical protein
MVENSILSIRFSASGPIYPNHWAGRPKTGDLKGPESVNSGFFSLVILSFFEVGDIQNSNSG